jgi:predicted RNase H-like HicB family nuclease
MDFHARIRQEDDGTYWAEVKELPGCFASGRTLDELKEGLIEAIGLCLPDAAAPSNGVAGEDRARVDELKLVTV